jgi:hypothetical protein
MPNDLEEQPWTPVITMGLKLGWGVVLEGTCVESEPEWHETFVFAMLEMNHGVVGVWGPRGVGINANRAGCIVAR